MPLIISSASAMTTGIGRVERAERPWHVFHLHYAPRADNTNAAREPQYLPDYFLVLPAAQSYAVLLNRNDHRGRKEPDWRSSAASSTFPFAYGVPARRRVDQAYPLTTP